MKGNFYENIYTYSKRHSVDKSPISKFCDCYTCKNYSMSYIYTLFKQEDSLAARLGTIHNLRFYSQLMEILRKAKGQ